ncbi:beta-lactamase-like protein [Cytidiella melzeri]|nr:beta-lactamase-like protein [Cytidiella melzeri]
MPPTHEIGSVGALTFTPCAPPSRLPPLQPPPLQPPPLPPLHRGLWLAGLVLGGKRVGLGGGEDGEGEAGRTAPIPFVTNHPQTQQQQQPASPFVSPPTPPNISASPFSPPPPPHSFNFTLPDIPPSTSRSRPGTGSHSRPTTASSGTTTLLPISAVVASSLSLPHPPPSLLFPQQREQQQQQHHGGLAYHFVRARHWRGATRSQRSEVLFLYAYAYSNWGLTAHAYTTLPVQAMARVAATEDVEGVCLTIIPFNAGHTLGGTIWKIRSPSAGTILYAVDMNHMQERHLDGTVLMRQGSNASVFETLQRPDLLITDAERANVTTARRKDWDAALLFTVLAYLVSVLSIV